MLIKLVYQLPYLITSKLHSLTSDKQMNVIHKEYYQTYSIEHQVHISKVSLQVLNNMEDFDSIMALCPLTMHLQMVCINNMNVMIIFVYCVAMFQH